MRTSFSPDQKIKIVDKGFTVAKEETYQRRQGFGYNSKNEEVFVEKDKLTGTYHYVYYCANKPVDKRYKQFGTFEELIKLL